MTVDILTGDALSRLRELPAGVFQACVTSPPYYSLRDYGQAEQIGLEDTPDAFAAKLVEVFREVRRVLRPDGTLWLNLGDSYAADRSYQVAPTKWPSLPQGQGSRVPPGLKPKDLIGVPWLVAFALRADGWWLRKAIIWHKPNPMPESVTDRPTSSHEYVFLLAPSDRYFYDAEAIKEAERKPDWDDGSRVFGGKNKHGANLRNNNTGRVGTPRDRGLPPYHAKYPSSDQSNLDTVPRGQGRNARDVWTIATQPCGDQLCQRCGRYYPGRESAKLPRRKADDGRERSVCRCGADDGWLAHYAVMPPDLAERCIKAGTSERGQCPTCGTPWRRITERTRLRDGQPLSGSWAKPDDARRLGATGTGHWRDTTEVRTTGWAPGCDCPIHEPVPQAVLDPFGGAGTTGLVAARLQRRATLLELNPGYAALAQARIHADAPLLQGAAAAS